MADLERQIRAFRTRLSLRQAAQAALWGLLAALVVIIAAPWLRQWLGAPDYLVSLILPAALPALMALTAWLRRPDRQTAMLSAEAWTGNTGAVVAASEMEGPQPFAGPVLARAQNLLGGVRMPEPRHLRQGLVSLVVLLALLPISRWAHAESQPEPVTEIAKGPGVPPAEAAKLAEEAAREAERARELGARNAERLASDIERAARDVESGAADPERALREAHFLSDRARALTEGAAQRAAARKALAENALTRDLAEAMESADARATDMAADKLSRELIGPDGLPDSAKADALRETLRAARQAAPSDPALRRAAEALEQALSESARRNAEESRRRAEQAMIEQGRTAEEIAEALQRMAELDQKALRQMLNELARNAGALRDLAEAGQLDELLRQLRNQQLTPEQAQALARQAREMAERLQLDAEALRRMLQEGAGFEGLEQLARELAQQRGGGNQPSPGGTPDWMGQGRNQPGGGPGTEGGGHVGNKGGTKAIDTPGADGAVDTADTGRGPRDPDGRKQELDPTRAGDESANRQATGRESTSRGINTREDDERLPRRYRETARRYFER